MRVYTADKNILGKERSNSLIVRHSSRIDGGSSMQIILLPTVSIRVASERDLGRRSVASSLTKPRNKDPP